MLLAPRLPTTGWQLRFTLDGVVTFLSEPTASKSASLYSQIFRNGAIEHADREVMVWNGPGIVRAVAVEMDILGATWKLLRVFNYLGILPPYYIFPSLLNVRGLKLKHCPGAMYGDETRVIEHEHLMLPEVLIEDPTAELDQLFRPTFDVLWNSCGWPRSLIYDRAGKYEVDWKQHCG